MVEIAEKFEELKQIKAPGERYTVLYLLKARVAAGLENKEAGSETISKSIGEMWNEAASYVDRIAEQDPDQAFRLALLLSLLPENKDPNLEKVYQWTRSDGPVLLAKDELKESLLKYFESDPSAPEFVDKMEEYMAFDIKGVDREEVFHEPSCFLAVVTMYFGSRLENESNKLAKKLFSSATEKLADREIAEVVRYYKKIEDVAWIVEQLEPFLPEVE